jgi:hypothetical protein
MQNLVKFPQNLYDKMHISVHYMDWWKWNIPPLHIGLHLFSKIVITLCFQRSLQYTQGLFFINFLNEWRLDNAIVSVGIKFCKQMDNW